MEESVLSVEPVCHISKPDEQLWIYSMGKRFRVTAMFTNDEDANRRMERHADESVIACFGPFVILAEKYSGVKS